MKIYEDVYDVTKFMDKSLRIYISMSSQSFPSTEFKL